MRAFQRFGISAVLAAIAGSATAAPETPPTYSLSMHFEDGDQLIGNPRLQVQAGKPAMILVGNQQKNSFSMQITATPQVDGTLAVVSNIDAVSTSGVHRRAAPTMVVKLDRPSTIEFGEQSATASPVRVSFTYQLVSGG